jgi:hypothetical protein
MKIHNTKNGMKKHLVKFSIAVTALIAIATPYLGQHAEASVSGSNQAISYDATNTSLVPMSNDSHIHMSEDGNVIAWYSDSRSIISGDTGSGYGIYVKNKLTGTTSIADVNLSGSHGWAPDVHFALSRTGRYIVFTSNNTNMVASPSVPTSPSQTHIYLRDTQTGTTTLVDQSSTGVLANLGTTGSPYPLSVTDDGRYVIFLSWATNLLSAYNPTAPNATAHYYLKDMQTGQVMDPLRSSSGTYPNNQVGYMDTSCDGSFLVFGSSGTNITPQDNGKMNTYLIDLRNGYSISNLTYNANNGARPVSISCNGRYIVMYSASTNLTSDSVSGSINHWFRYDRLTGTYALVDKSTSGYISSTYPPDTSISGPVGWGGTIVSDNGLVVFRDYDKNLVSPATTNTNEVFVRNPEANTTEHVSVNASGVEENASYSGIHTLEINSRGDSVIYDSSATNLVPGITSGTSMIVSSKLQ